jgi:hypothetical protein
VSSKEFGIIFTMGWKLPRIRFLCIRNLTKMFGALKSDSTYHFFRNACTKSWSLRLSQFSGCWLILSVYILMSFDFLFRPLSSSSAILILMVFIACDLVELQQHVIVMFLVDFSSVMVDGDPKTSKTVI